MGRRTPPASKSELEIIDERIKKAFPELVPSAGHDLLDELIGSLRVARTQRDGLELQLKPNKNIEAPPYDRIRNDGGCYKHKFEWILSPMKQYCQQICKICGVSGETKKYE